jgi:hypothetical protein
VPLKSKAQMKYLFSAQERGEVPKGTAEKFVKETPKKKLAALPEYKREDDKSMRKLAKAKKAKK